MEDILSINLDTVANPAAKNRSQRNDGRVVNPFDHYEVECNKNICLYSGEELKEADAVYAKSSATLKALIHVKGVVRKVLETNAPWFYTIPQLLKNNMEDDENVAQA